MTGRKKSGGRVKSGGRKKSVAREDPLAKTMGLKKGKTMFGEAVHKDLARIIRLDEPEEAVRSVDRLIDMYWTAKTEGRQLAIKRSTVLAANRAAAFQLKKDLSEFERKQMESVEKIYRKGVARMEKAPSPPQTRYYTDRGEERLFALHGGLGAKGMTRSDMEERLKELRADDRDKGFKSSYRTLEWAGEWYIYWRMESGMMNPKTLRFE